MPSSHGEVVEELSEPEEGMTRIPKGRQGIRCAKKKNLKFSVEKVTIGYILAIQDSTFRSNKTMFMNSQVGASIARKIGKFSGTSCRSEPSVGITGAALAD
jgi:hypothetical protein